ncbi:MAG: Rnf-Nqr domain containing protein [Oscillospiraceae bacterium]
MIVFQYISLILSGILVENIFFTRALDAGNMIDLVNEPRKILDFSVTFTVSTTIGSILCAVIDKLLFNFKYIGYARPTIYLLVISVVYIAIYYILRNYKQKGLDKYKHLLSYACINSGVYGVLFVNQRYENNILES